MPAMTTHRRLACLLITLAVAWAALWPVVSSARAFFSGEQVMLCHQAGMQVDPSAPPQDGGKVHCPLCIMAFYGAFAPAPKPPPALFGVATAVTDTHCAPLTADVAIQLPQSRAPPR
jgi:hypothetical protein